MSEAMRSRLRAVLLSRYTQLRRKVEYIVGSSDSAADALQETWLRLESMPNTASVANPDAYILQMAVNAATDQYRREKRKLTDDDIDALFEIEDELSNPERIAMARSDIALLEEALRKLTPRRRDILLAAHVDGLLNREIAERFGISQSLVEKELRHALRYCQERMGTSTFNVKLGGPRKF